VRWKLACSTGVTLFECCGVAAPARVEHLASELKDTLCLYLSIQLSLSLARTLIYIYLYCVSLHYK